VCYIYLLLKKEVYMANRLKMEKAHAIIGLLEHGWSHRRIARELGIDRGTVSRYDRLRREGSKAAIPAPGSDTSGTSNPAKATPGSGSSWDPKPAIPTPGTAPGRASLCEPFREVITGYLEAGLHGQRIWQDLRYEHGFTGSYSSVKRFIRRLGSSTPLPYRRISTEPGQEVQVDFGSGAWVVEGKRKHRPHSKLTCLLGVILLLLAFVAPLHAQGQDCTVSGKLTRRSRTLDFTAEL